MIILYEKTESIEHECKSSRLIILVNQNKNKAYYLIITKHKNKRIPYLALAKMISNL